MKGNFNNLNFILVFSTVIFALPVFSETILLRNGESVKGKILNQNYSKIIIATDGQDEAGQSQTLEISKADIVKVIYKEISEEEARLRLMEEEKLQNPQSEEEIKKKEEAILLEKQKAEEEEKRKNEEFAQKKSEWESKQISRFGSLGRSALLPGWGQYANDRKTSGMIYGVLFFTSAFALYNKNREYLNAKRDYENIGNPYSEAQYFTNFYGAATTTSVSQAALLDPATAYLYYHSNTTILQREAVERHYNEVKRLSYLVAGIYIINLIDAFFRYEKPTYTGLDKGFFMDYSIARSNSIGYSPNASSQMNQQYTFGYKFNLDY